MIEAIGYLGSAGAAVMWIPQTTRIVRHRHDHHALAGVSLGAYAVAICFNALLLTYGLAKRADPVVLAAAINLVCASVIVTVIGAVLLRTRSPRT